MVFGVKGLKQAIFLEVRGYEGIMKLFCSIIKYLNDEIIFLLYFNSFYFILYHQSKYNLKNFSNKNNMNTENDVI